MFYIDKNYPSSDTFDMTRLTRTDENTQIIDPLNSHFWYNVDNLRRAGDYVVTLETAYRPDVISWTLYDSTQYWWILLIYNGITNVDDLKPETRLKYPDLTYMEGIYFNYRQEEPDRDPASGVSGDYYADSAFAITKAFIGGYFVINSPTTDGVPLPDIFYRVTSRGVVSTIFSDYSTTSWDTTRDQSVFVSDSTGADQVVHVAVPKGLDVVSIVNIQSDIGGGWENLGEYIFTGGSEDKEFILYETTKSDLGEVFWKVKATESFL